VSAPHYLVWPRPRRGVFIFGEYSAHGGTYAKKKARFGGPLLLSQLNSRAKRRKRRRFVWRQQDRRLRTPLFFIAAAKRERFADQIIFGIVGARLLVRHFYFTARRYANV
jgi:hypothetical protein